MQHVYRRVVFVLGCEQAVSDVARYVHSPTHYHALPNEASDRRDLAREGCLRVLMVQDVTMQ